MRKTELLRTCTFFLIALAFVCTAQAQNTKIQGVIKDADDEPIIGASVIVKGTTTGTMTSADGDYSIDVPSTAILEFKMIGYVTQEIRVGNKTKIDVVLKDETKELDQVIVIGYGTSRKSDVTGSVASVNRDEMLVVPTTNVGEMLRGRVAGVEISQGSSRPGGSSSIFIRGKRSLSASNEPLYIVDGVPAENIDDINANDIKSVEVLKDASSQAIYGARASAGVILVTTVRGETGKTKIDVTANFSQQKLKRNFDLFTGEELIGMSLAQNQIYGGVQNATEDEILSAIGDNMLKDNYKAGKIANWYDELIQTAYQQSYNVTVRGGTEITKVMSSFNYYQQDGMINNTGYTRGTARLNIDQKLFKSISLGANVAYNISEQKSEDGVEGGSSTSGGSTLIQQALTMSPYANPYDGNGNVLRYVNSDNKFNPIWNTQESSDKRIRNNLAMTIFVDWQIFKDLKYRFNANYTFKDSKRKSYESSAHEQGSKSNGWGQFKFDTSNEWLIENILSYEKKINKDNRIEATLVQSANALSDESFTQSAKQFLTDYFGADGITSANFIDKPSRSIARRQIASFMARARYSLYDRYLLTASIRADGSSIFPANNKWGYFPSLALAWRINQEKFLVDNNYLSNLKLRLSYGSVGNQGTGPYQTTANTSGSQMQFGNDGGYVQGLLPSTKMHNPNLKWEKTTSYNLGLDFGFLKERFTGSAELYTTNTTDLLVIRSLGAVTGYERQTINLGKVTNKGVELQLGATILDKKDFSWSANATFSKNKNEIVRIDGRSDANGKPLDQTDNNWYIGQAMDVYLDYKFDGIFNDIEEVRISAQGKDLSGNPLSDADLEKKIGSIRVKDTNGDGILNEKDRDFYNRSPKWMGSISTTVSYKGFDLLIDFYTSQGATIRNSYLYDYNQGGTYSGKMNGIKRDYWTPEGKGQEAPLPRINSTDSYIRSLGYQDASYLRIRTIQLGYNFPPKLLRNMKISKARVFGTLSNYFTWTDFKSFGPENSPSSYPEPKTASVGLNLSF